MSYPTSTQDLLSSVGTEGTPLPRTQDEIVARLTPPTDDLFDFGREVLVDYLDFAHARGFLKEGVTEGQWNEAGAPAPRTVEFASAAAKSYMSFAWSKANNERGISAARSIRKMEAWMWLLGEDDLVEACGDDYSPYGKPVLAKICEKMGWPNEDQ